MLLSLGPDALTHRALSCSHCRILSMCETVRARCVKVSVGQAFGVEGTWKLPTHDVVATVVSAVTSRLHRGHALWPASHSRRQASQKVCSQGIVSVPSPLSPPRHIGHVSVSSLRVPVVRFAIASFPQNVYLLDSIHLHEIRIANSRRRACRLATACGSNSPRYASRSCTQRERQHHDHISPPHYEAGWTVH